MKMTSVMIVLVSLALVVIIAAWEWTHTTSPGPLNPTHESVKRLRGNSGCAECHGSKSISMAEACFSCHAEIRTQIDTHHGAHGVKEAAVILACGKCHAEHGGANLQLIASHSFADAGLPEPAKFDHSQLTKFVLIGRHTELKCEQCHRLAHATTLASGEARFLGLSQSCVSCHKDVHKGTFGADCESCHGQVHEFKAAPQFTHSDKFPLAGVHAIKDCKKCHNESGTTSFTALSHGSFAVRACAACHQDPHKGSFGVDCQNCHSLTAPFKQPTRFVHTDKFPLALGHALPKCEQCHATTGLTSVAALRKGEVTVRTCVACHKDPHEGSYGQSCSSCHSLMKWSDGIKTLKHTAAFPLTGSHGGISCMRCHDKLGSHSVASLQAKSLSVRSCVECHASPHSKTLLAFVADSSHRAEGETCTLCHRPESTSFLSPTAQMTPAQHAGTGFKLDPPHAKVDCVACHKEMGTRKALASGPALNSQFTKLFPGRSPGDCVACHADPHRGQFSTGVTKGSCVACHAMTHFVPNTFDVSQHDRTHFPLTGGHRAVACANCHTKQNGVTRFVGTPASCSACHADFHQGQLAASFKTGGRNPSDCAACHVTASFSKVIWTPQEHAQWAGYSLNGAHATTACTNCHKRRTNADDQGFTWSAAPKRCSDCHADAHANQFARDSVTDCARCHSERGKFTKLVFDHQRDSIFKLDQTHARLACAACHKAVEIAPAAKVVRYKPLGVNCEDCHGVRAKEAR